MISSANSMFSSGRSQGTADPEVQNGPTAPGLKALIPRPAGSRGGTRAARPRPAPGWGGCGEASGHCHWPGEGPGWARLGTSPAPLSNLRPRTWAKRTLCDRPSRCRLHLEIWLRVARLREGGGHPRATFQVQDAKDSWRK